MSSDKSVLPDMSSTSTARSTRSDKSQTIALLREQLNAMQRTIDSMSSSFENTAHINFVHTMLADIISSLQSLAIAQQTLSDRVDQVEDYLSVLSRGGVANCPNTQQADGGLSSQSREETQTANQASNINESPIDGRFPGTEMSEAAYNLGQSLGLTMQFLPEELSFLSSSIEIFVQQHLTGPYDSNREELRDYAASFTNKIHPVDILMGSSFRPLLCCAIINRLLDFWALTVDLYSTYKSPIITKYREKKQDLLYYPQRHPGDIEGLGKSLAEAALFAGEAVSQDDFKQHLESRILSIRDLVIHIVSSLIPASRFIDAGNDMKAIVTRAFLIAVRMSTSPHDYPITFAKHQDVVENNTTTEIRNIDKLAASALKLVRFSVKPLILQKSFTVQGVREVVIQKSLVVAMPKQDGAAHPTDA